MTRPSLGPDDLGAAVTVTPGPEYTDGRPFDGVIVSYVRPRGDQPAGFYVQPSHGEPSLWPASAIRVKDGTLGPGRRTGGGRPRPPPSGAG